MNCSNPFWAARLIAAVLVLSTAAMRPIPVGAVEPQRITKDGALKLSPVFADRGESVIFSVHDEPTRVALVRLGLADGRQEKVDPSLTAHLFDADVSADGRYLCFVMTYTSPQSILVIRDLKEKTEARFIPRDARATVRGPKIAPDMQRVVFALSDAGGQQIAAVDMKGENLKRLTESAGTNAWPALAPDGKTIAFSSSRDASFKLYLMNADGNNVRPLTRHAQRDMRPAWSPDGKRLAFVSAHEGNLEIYIVDADGANLRRVTNHPDRDDFPIWHPDGKRLLIIAERNGDSDLYFIDATGEPVVQ
jgi:Tol biopolymer transport system component